MDDILDDISGSIAFEATQVAPTQDDFPVVSYSQAIASVRALDSSINDFCYLVNIVGCR